MKVDLWRSYTSSEGTFGAIFLPSITLFTGELPWKENRTGISCIPEGSYVVKPYSSKKYPRAFQVMAVPGRVGILFHSGNFCGDISLGYMSNIRGCILVGTGVGRIKSQRAIISSKKGMELLLKATDWKEFELEIKNDF